MKQSITMPGSIFANGYIKYAKDPRVGHITKDSFWKHYRTWGVSVPPINLVLYAVKTIMETFGLEEVSVATPTNF